MQIDLMRLTQGVSMLDFELAPPSVGITPEDVIVEGPLKLHLSLDRRGDEIWIRGRLQLVAVQECSRCLTDFKEPLNLEFEVFCAKVHSPNVVSASVVDEDDQGVHVHDGRILSIDHEIREAVILGLSMKPLCKETCAGLCPTCGDDRNLGPCRCARAAAG
jgi:uncharacterized protein